MTVDDILKRAAAEGLALTPTPAGTLKVRGPEATVDRWLPVLAAHKSALLEALRESRNPSDPRPSSASA